MELVAGHERKVIATVCSDGGEEGDHVPDGSCEEVSPHQGWSQHHYDMITDDVLHGVCVHRRCSNWSCKLVVLLVETFVQGRIVERPAKERMETHSKCYVDGPSGSWKVYLIPHPIP